MTDTIPVVDMTVSDLREELFKRGIFVDARDLDLQEQFDEWVNVLYTYDRIIDLSIDEQIISEVEIDGNE